MTCEGVQRGNTTLKNLTKSTIPFGIENKHRIYKELLSNCDICFQEIWKRGEVYLHCVSDDIKTESCCELTTELQEQEPRFLCLLHEDPSVPE